MRDYRLYLKDIFFGVDYQLVWRTIKERLPQIKPEVQKIVRDLA